MDNSKIALIGAVILGFCLFNFIPTIVAYARQHPERRLLASLNVLAMVSFLLWAALLVWAIGGKRDDSLIGRMAAQGNRRAMAALLGLLFLGGAGATIYAALGAG